MANQLDELASYEHQVKDLTKDQQARSVVVSKIPRVTQKHWLQRNLVIRHFESVQNGGGKIECIQFTNEETDAIITFESSKVVEKVMDFPHVFGGTDLEVCRYSAEAFYEFMRLSSKPKVTRRKSRKNKDEPQPSPGITRKAPLTKSLSDQGHKRREKRVQTDVADNLSEAETLPDELAQLRQMLANEVQFRKSKEQELMEMEVIVLELLEEQTRIADAQQEKPLISDLAQMRSTLDEKERSIDEMQRTLEEERQARLAVNEEEEKLRNDLDQMRKTLDVRERTIVKLQNAVDEEQQAKTAMSEELSQARTALIELEETVAEERLQKTTLEERLRDLEDRMEEERNSHLSTKMELQSAVSAAGQRLQEENQQKTALQERIRTLENEKEEVLAESRDWIIPRDEVFLGNRVLGRGAYGEVHEGTFRGCKVAVKKIHEVVISDYNCRIFEREISIASRCRHPHLLQLIGATNETGECPLLIVELLDTSLREVVKDRALNQSEIFGLSLDVTKGLNYLHLHKPQPIIHRDISSANVLLWSRGGDCWRAKLSDYGSVNFVCQATTKNPGSPLYSAPEASDASQHSPKMDVYSFGVLLCEMCTREQPDPQERHKQISRVNGDLRKLIQRCVKESPQPRPDINVVLSRLEELCKSKGSVWRRLLKLHV